MQFDKMRNGGKNLVKQLYWLEKRIPEFLLQAEVK
jgi:hypothetical protein